MRLVLLSGGSGKRLWPLSNDSRSKQFLKVLNDGSGGLESMVQRVWRQLGEVGLQQLAYLTTSNAQLDMIKSQLGADVPIIAEPMRRDTFPAIALAAAYLYTVEGVSMDEAVIVLPVDPYVDNSFFNKLQELEQIIQLSDADLALLGVTPTFPSSKYGYIVPLDSVETQGDEPAAVRIEGDYPAYSHVSQFREKPDAALAEQLIAEGALWNCGVFGFRLGYLIELLKQRELATDYALLLQQYNQMPKKSFDYEVVEQAEKIVVTAYAGGWKDLGTWNTLSEEMATTRIGKGIVSEDCQNTHLVNELDIPITILGLSDIIVAASPDGILVSDKASSPRLKELMKDEHHRPMYEERRWGWYKVLDYTKFPDGNEVLTKRICIATGKNLSYQLHHKRSETWTIISGTGELVLDGIFYTITAGEVMHVPLGAKHSVRAITELEFIEVQFGTELVEEDIVRLSLDWNVIEKLCIS